MTVQPAGSGLALAHYVRAGRSGVGGGERLAIEPFWPRPPHR